MLPLVMFTGEIADAKVGPLARSTKKEEEATTTIVCVRAEA